jgi:outer membrane protein insertion porin family
LGGGTPQIPANVPLAILNEVGDHIYNRFGMTLAYDSRNSTRLPNHGQLTEFTPQVSIGDVDYYKLELSSAWYFPGITIPGNAFFRGHVIEVGGRVGTAKSFEGGDVPFYDRYYLGGLYSLRGFKYRNISPREPGFVGVDEPIGGDSYWFGSVEYSFPIIEKDDGPSLRFAVFYDVGSIGVGSYSFSGNFDDNWGLGLRLDIPQLGPLRLDYGIPIHHDQYNGNGGQFQFDVGYTRPF